MSEWIDTYVTNEEGKRVLVSTNTETGEKVERVIPQQDIQPEETAPDEAEEREPELRGPAFVEPGTQPDEEGDE